LPFYHMVRTASRRERSMRWPLTIPHRRLSRTRVAQKMHKREVTCPH
jgi:hypothetical protein